MPEKNDDISDELTAKLIHFHDVTQIEDFNRCKEILSQHNWNVEQAVQSTFADHNAVETQELSSPVSSPSPPNSDNELRRRHISPPRPLLPRQQVVPRQMIYVGGRPRRPPEGIFGWGYYLIFLPLRYTVNQVFSILRFVFRLFFPDPREQITDPFGDVISFINEFHEKYPNHPEFFRGSYGSARDEAKKQIRFLLLYLHDSKHTDTDAFCKEALCHKDSIHFLNRKVILWGCSISKPEGYKVSKIVRNPTYPLLALVCLYQNQMSVVGRLQGRITSDELIARLTEMMEVYEPSLVSARADKNERSQNVLLRQEQDEAYRISLRKDKEKLDMKLKKEEEARQAMEKKEKIKQEKELKRNLCIQRKERCKEELLPEPSESGNKIFELVIKLPNGTRLKRKFLSTDTVKTLHDFIYAQEHSPLSFQVFSNFPRRLLPGCSTNVVDDVDVHHQSLEAIGLSRNDTLFVQTLHTDDEDSDEDDGDTSP